MDRINIEYDFLILMGTLKRMSAMSRGLDIQRLVGLWNWSVYNKNNLTKNIA